MAKLKDACMLCGEYPCVCLPRKTSVKRPRDIKTVHAPILSTPVAVKTIARPTMTQDEAIMISALQALAPLLHPDELDRHSMLLKHELSATERSLVWQAME